MGFTLIELMLVVAIIGLLAAIAIPKFADLVIKSKEASARGTLGALRSAIHIFYADNEGVYPPSGATGGLNILTIGGKYMNAIPAIAIPAPGNHSASSGVNDNEGFADDYAGGYLFYYEGTPPPASMMLPTPIPSWWGEEIYFPLGSLLIMCSHTDSRGQIWSSY
jgi:prepilin-type N-terminal cleavage/methylation domain-containing protein